MKSTLAFVPVTLLLVAPLALAACGGVPTPPASAPTTSGSPAPAASTACAPQPPTAGRLRLHVTFTGGVPDAAVDGRLLVAMSSSPDVTNPFEVGMAHMDQLWMAALDVKSLPHGDAVEVDPDTLAFPHPFSQAPPGKYRVSARLAREGAPGIAGPVVEQTFDPAHAGTIELTLEEGEPKTAPLADTDGVKFVHVPSKLLSAFYGRPVTMDAAVLLPPSYGTVKGRRYATEYYVPGFGGSLEAFAPRFEQSRKTRAEAHYPELVRVILPGMLPSGHHVFADSINDGPWGSALVQELIPALEKQFALVSAPRGRLLSGHSSGGWSSLWVMITHPDFFGGTWSTAPDPVDFRNFTTIDVTPGSTDNFYKNKDGTLRMIMRVGGHDVFSVKQFALFDEVTGKVGALGTFDWVFSPRGPLGAPMHIVNAATGEQDPAVQKAWEKWDIHKVLDAGWATLGPKLKGKLHLFVGDADTFHLNESMSMLCDFLKSKGSDAVCEIVPGKDHGTLTGDAKDPQSLTWRIEHEMAAVAGVK